MLKDIWLLGAVNGIFNMLIETYPVVEIKFYNNYRFSTNERMKKLDSFIRSMLKTMVNLN